MVCESRMELADDEIIVADRRSGDRSNRGQYRLSVGVITNSFSCSHDFSVLSVRKAYGSGQNFTRSLGGRVPPSRVPSALVRRVGRAASGQDGAVVSRK